MKTASRKRLTKHQRENLLALTAGHCAYCGTEITLQNMQADHVEAIHRGGADEINNILPACRSCNHYKHTLTLEEYREYVETILDRLKRDSTTYNVAVRFGIIEPKPQPVIFYFEEMEA